MRISDWSSDVCSSDLRCSIASSRYALTSCVALIRSCMLGECNNAVSQVRNCSTSSCGRPKRSKKIETGKGMANSLTKSQRPLRSEEHTSELQSLMRISYAVFCLKKKTKYTTAEINRL